ncbi:MAG: ABC transporter ATP-binding protein [Tissierellia bacterium]|nr:ABC transporter ATP-binding protein [Tissierellia bacterium]
MKKYIKSEKLKLLFAILFTLSNSILAVRIQFVKGEVLDFALVNDIDASIRFAIFLGILIVIELITYYLYDILRSKFTASVMKILRQDYFKSLLKRNYPAFIEKNSGEYIAQFTNELVLIENQFFATIPLLSEIIIKILIVSIFLFKLNTEIAIITIILLSTPLYVPKLIENRLKKTQKAYIDEFEALISKYSDWLKGFETIKNFGIENNIFAQFRKLNRNMIYKNWKNKKIRCTARVISSMLSYFSHFIILVYAIRLVLINEFSAGEFFVAIGMIDQLSYPILNLNYLIQDILQVRSVNENVLEFIQYKDKNILKENISIRDFNEIRFEDVSFGYKDNLNILTDLNIKFERNKKYLISGPSGSGKTSAINLLLNYYKPNKGEVYIDNLEVEKIYNLNSLITIMRQDSIIFNTSLRNNLAMYQEISDDKLIEMLKSMGLNKFADKKALEMIISEDGSNLSGGEKRRISLIRTLLRETPILILDEPTANLDHKNIKIIKDFIKRISDKTVIVISHQIDEKNCDEFDYIYNIS